MQSSRVLSSKPLREKKASRLTTRSDFGTAPPRKSKRKLIQDDLYQRLIHQWRLTQTSQADSSYPILVAVNQFINTVVAEEKGPYKHQISEELLDSLALAIRGMKIKESKLHEMYRINKRKNASSVQIYFNTCGTLVKSKCNFDFKFKNPPRVLSCIFGFEVCFLNSSLNPG